MSRRRNYPQYGERTSENVRQILLARTLRVVRGAQKLAGVQRVALIGPLATNKGFPKEVDVLVPIADEIKLHDLADVERQLAGAAQEINGRAEVFLPSSAGEYLGRTCPWRVWGPGMRARCGAAYRSGRQFLRDDLHALKLPRELTASPPAELWPRVAAYAAIPYDVEARLLQPLRAERCTYYVNPSGLTKACRGRRAVHDLASSGSTCARRP